MPNKGLLVLVKNDEVSDRVLETAKRFGWDGNILTLSEEQAVDQGPLPAVLCPGASYSNLPLIEAYFQHLSHYKK